MENSPVYLSITSLSKLPRNSIGYLSISANVVSHSSSEVGACCRSVQHPGAHVRNQPWLLCLPVCLAGATSLHPRSLSLTQTPPPPWGVATASLIPLLSPSLPTSPPREARARQTQQWDHGLPESSPPEPSLAVPKPSPLIMGLLWPLDALLTLERLPLPI